MHSVPDEILRFTDFAKTGGELTAVPITSAGRGERVAVRVSVEREHRRADGELVSSGEVASSDDGSVVVGGAGL